MQSSFLDSLDLVLEVNWLAGRPSDVGVFEDRSYQGIEDVNKVLRWNSGPLEHS